VRRSICTCDDAGEAADASEVFISSECLSGPDTVPVENFLFVLSCQ
jgi:hypothetical protein